MRFWDPDGAKYGIPTYPLRMAPEGLATRRQLRARGLRPGGQDPVAQLMWRYPRGIAHACLYRIDRAKPVRPMTAGRWRAHEAMMRPRRTCDACRRDVGYVVRTSTGLCAPCDPALSAAPPAPFPFFDV
ncbi:RRQRL motif-containing zinc-binding protein [Streptomyces griseoruber]|uniref:RRQRL motif-containing zinc-binding protein n=1 Tax=Streptomyces griseoruber TaxID=1943 RepID=UPI0037A14234